ncbi:MAG: proline--tRNA ligase [Rhodospirillaceae bacterium]
MRLSRAFIPTLKEIPTEAQIVSHRLMLRAGLVRQHAAGIYNWLPTGALVLSKIAEIVRKEQNDAGAQEIIMPTIQSGELWKESGRYNDYGPEMLRIKDRHKRDMLYGPTHEEVVTDIFRNNVKSYKDLPLNLYQIHWKFRDEVRPRFGVMRGREFLMKDAYSFDRTYEAAKLSYNKMFVAYLRIFARMGLKAIPMKADPGPIGGDLSHEFIVLADTGESKVYCDSAFLEKPIPLAVDYESDLQEYIDVWTSDYAATDEEYDREVGEELGDKLIEARGIEVGHIFHFGQKYTSPMRAKILGPDGKMLTPYMGSYGIGVSRLVGAIIEACHDEDGIIWPDAVTPYQIGLVNLKSGAEVTDKICDEIYKDLGEMGLSTLYDDRDERAGVKFSNMDLLGMPWQLIVGPKGLKAGTVELKRRATGERQELSLESVMSKLNQHFAEVSTSV